MGDANDWVVTQRLLREHDIEADIDEIRAIFDGVYWGTENTPGLFETETFIGGREPFIELAQRIPIGIVTGRPRRDARSRLSKGSD